MSLGFVLWQIPQSAGNARVRHRFDDTSRKSKSKSLHNRNTRPENLGWGHGDRRGVCCSYTQEFEKRQKGAACIQYRTCKVVLHFTDSLYFCDLIFTSRCEIMNSDFVFWSCFSMHNVCAHARPPPYTYRCDEWLISCLYAEAHNPMRRANSVQRAAVFTAPSLVARRAPPHKAVNVK